MACMPPSPGCPLTWRTTTAPPSWRRSAGKSSSWPLPSGRCLPPQRDADGPGAVLRSPGPGALLQGPAQAGDEACLEAGALSPPLAPLRGLDGSGPNGADALRPGDVAADGAQETQECFTDA